MSKGKFSHGPWVAIQHGKTSRFTISQEATKHIGAICNEVYGENNAALIAAAPDLLGVCEYLVESFTDGTLSLQDIDRAKEVIRKAKGIL